MRISAYSGKAQVFIEGRGWTGWIDRDTAERIEKEMYGSKGVKNIVIASRKPRGACARTLQRALVGA